MQAEGKKAAGEPAGTTVAGDKLFNSGQYEEAARWFADFVARNPRDDKLTPPALLKLGLSLDKLADGFSTTAEKECYWAGGAKARAGTACMKANVDKLNAKYSPGSFEYSEQMLVIKYTGVHFRRVVDEFGKSPYAAEAEYFILTQSLIGHPDVVLPKIKGYLSRYKDGEWYRKGLLLRARVNEDIWWIHRKWSWVLYNWQVAPEELIVKSEPYRQEAMRAFQELIQKFGKTTEGNIAKKELELLRKYQDDGKLYGIVNEADIEGTRAIPTRE